MAMNILSLLTGNGSKSEDTKIQEFLGLLIEPDLERRGEDRTPCYRKLTIYADDGTGPIPAAMRDISETGIGLVHEVPLEPGEYSIRIPINDGPTICARVKIVWCQSTMKHCYISGGPFVDVFIDDPVTLMN